MKKQATIRGTSGAIQTVRRDGCVFVLEPRNCGKPTCSKCPHGPYWFRVDGHTKRYVGKELTREAIDRVKARS